MNTPERILFYSMLFFNIAQAMLLIAKSWK
jgi:hypothetical protein